MRTNTFLKILFCVGLYFLCITSSSAQDNIIKKDGTEVLSKVMEIGETHIKYKNFSNLEGPVYTIPISDVFMIKYENGEKDIFKEADAQPAASESKKIGFWGYQTNDPQPALPADWKMKWDIEVAPAFTVLTNQKGGGKNMTGFGVIYGFTANIINQSSGGYIFVGGGGLSANYSVTEKVGAGQVKAEQKNFSVHFDLGYGKLTSLKPSSMYYQMGLRFGILVIAKEATTMTGIPYMPDTQGEFELIDDELLNRFQLGLPFEIGGIISKRVKLGIGGHLGFLNMFDSKDIKVTPMEAYLKVGVRL